MITLLQSISQQYGCGDLVTVRMTASKFERLGIVVQASYDQLHVNVYWVWLDWEKAGPFFADELKQIKR